MHIELTVKTNAYRYLWLKHVRGFDPAVHCARCLKGSYANLLPYRADRAIPAGLQAAAEIAPDLAPYHYLCGVTSRWADNLHLVFQRQPGSRIEFEDPRIAVLITDAVQVPIRALPDEVAAGLTKEFWSCRNYQFGWQAFALSSCTKEEQ